MSEQQVKFVYFAWVRERMGIDGETLGVPSSVSTVGDMLQWLKAIDDNHQNALNDADSIRVALDQQHAHHDQLLGTPKEIAIFPPMTGG